MFYGRKQEYVVASPQLEYDEYNFATPEYQSQGTANIYIVVQDRTLTQSNDIELYTGTLVGYTDDIRIEKGWLIDSKYLVTSTLPHRRENILYLKEFQDGK